MANQSGTGRGFALGQKALAVGLRFAGGIVLFMFAGFWLDRRSGTLPLFTVTGTLVGAVLSFVSVYRELEADRKRRTRGAGQ